MTTTRWWWVRHAPVTATAGRIYGQDDPPCDTSDRSIFAALARMLPTGAVLITSQLQRTHQTADCISGAGLALPPPVVEPALAEQHFGDWQGRTFDEISAEPGAGHVHWLAPAELRPSGGESFTEVMARVHAVVRRTTRQFSGRDIISVAHGGPIRAALALALGLDGEQALAFSIDNCALTRADHIDGADGVGRDYWAVRFVNRAPGSGTARI